MKFYIETYQMKDKILKVIVRQKLYRSKDKIQYNRDNDNRIKY